MKYTLALLAAILCAGNLFAQTTLVTLPEKTEADRAAETLLSGPAQMADSLINQLRDYNAMIWKAKDPQAVLDKLGTSAVALFQDNTDTMTMAYQFFDTKGDTPRANKILEIQSWVLPHTKHPDGTITLIVPDPEPTPTPEP